MKYQYILNLIKSSALEDKGQALTSFLRQYGLIEELKASKVDNQVITELTKMVTSEDIEEISFALKTIEKFNLIPDVRLSLIYEKFNSTEVSEVENASSRSPFILKFKDISSDIGYMTYLMFWLLAVLILPPYLSKINVSKLNIVILSSILPIFLLLLLVFIESLLRFCLEKLRKRNLEDPYFSIQGFSKKALGISLISGLIPAIFFASSSPLTKSEKTYEYVCTTSESNSHLVFKIDETYLKKIGNDFIWLRNNPNSWGADNIELEVKIK